MTRTSAPVHARTRLTIAWEHYLPPPTTAATRATAATSQVSPVATTEPVADTSATPLTTTNAPTRSFIQKPSEMRK
jgi:hypothetical protein